MYNIFMHWTKLANTFYKKILFSALVLMSFVFITPKAHAAKLDVVPTFGSVHVGDNVKLRIVLSSSDQSANAMSGTVSFSSNLLTLNSISKSDSIVSLWPVEPSYSNSAGTVNFEGVILNGYTGSSGTVLTLFFKAKASGTAKISFANASVLANDGQGTQILNSTGESRFDIAEIQEKTTPTETTITTQLQTTEKVNFTIQVEEIKKKDVMDPRSRFLITSSTPIKNYRVEVDNTPYVWNDSGSHVFETIPLSRGIHLIKVYGQTFDGQSLSKSLSFTNSGISVPVFSDYSNDVVENEYMVVKGSSDPASFVVISSDALLDDNTSKHTSTTIKTNEKGLFTYVSEQRTVKGVYTISAHTRGDTGIESDENTPIKIVVKSNPKNIAGNLVNIASLVVPIVGLLVLLILITIFGWYKILHYKQRMHKRMLATKTLIDKSFGILEEDIDEEANILRKVKDNKPLTPDEKAFVTQFKKDITDAERTIISDIKDSGI